MEASLPTFCLALAMAAAPVQASEKGRGLSLAELVSLARANDLRVKEAEGQLAVLRGKYDEARWAWFPRLETTLLVAGPTPEARNDGLGGPPLTAATRMYDLDFGEAGVMMGAEISGFLPLYTFGKLDALKAAGAQGLLVGEGLRARAQDEAELQMAQAYYGYQLARQGKQSLTETLARLDDAGATLKRLFEQESPQVTQLDLYKVEFFRKQVEARLGAADSGMGFAQVAVRLISATPEAEPLSIEALDLTEPSVELRPVETYLAMAYQHRPELKAMEAGLAAREKEVFIRERMFLPDFGIAGFARWRWTTSATRQTSPFAYDPYNDASAGLALVSRISFDLPVKQAQLDQARAELEKLVTQRDLLRAAIRLEAEKAYGDLSDALARSRAQASAEKSARRWANAAAAGFDLGTGDTRELVDSFTAFATSGAEKLKAWHDAHVGVRALSRALGTPMSSPPPPVLAGPAPLPGTGVVH